MAKSGINLARLPSDTVHEHVNIFLKTPNSIYLGHIASAIVLLYIAEQNPAVPLWFKLAWAILEIIGYPLMMEVWRRSYLRKTPEERDPYRWIWLMDWLCLLVGVSWGTMTFVSLNPSNAADFAIQMSIAAGATSAAIRSLSTFPRSFVFYAVPFLGLLALRLFLFGGDFILLGGLVLVFLAMLLKFGRDVLESVSEYIEISNENLDLAQRYRDAANEAEHANREKTRLLAAASHDLRQPIHAIGLYMETLPLDRMEDRSRQTLSKIRNSLQTLSKLFNSLLDVSLLDSGKILVRPGTFDLEDMLNHVLDDYEPLAEIAHVTLLLECPKIGVNGDMVLIRRMVQNLLSNAIRHSEGGSVSLEVQHIAGEVSICVRDDGPGIAKEYRELIFEEFTQLSHRNNQLFSGVEKQEVEVEKGLGLGLAIVKRLADLQQYKLDLQSDRNGTALFIKGLKSAHLNDNAPPPLNPSRLVGERFKQKSVLVVDDDFATLEATLQLLKTWGCQVSTASSRKELETLEGPFDLLISDFAFEENYTGLDIVRYVRAKFGSHTKALVISGDSSEMVQLQVEKEGLLLIQKPVQPVQLRSAMLDAFAQSQAPAAE